MAPSSSGLGHRVFIPGIVGSTPTGVTMVETKRNGHIIITPAHPAPEVGGSTPSALFAGQVDLICRLHTFNYMFGQELRGNLKKR
jgi:hypothetical protein